MTKVYFESEQEARDLLEHIVIDGTSDQYTGLLPSQFEETIKVFKIAGFINRSPVEKVKDWIEEKEKLLGLHTIVGIDLGSLIDIKTAIQFLERGGKS